MNPKLIFGCRAEIAPGGTQGHPLPDYGKPQIHDFDPPGLAAACNRLSGSHPGSFRQRETSLLPRWLHAASEDYLRMDQVAG